MTIETDRLLLTPWTEADRPAFLAMASDPEVMWDYGAPWSEAEKHSRFERHLEAFARDGFGKWALRRKEDPVWLGYCGISPIWPSLAIAPGLEVGWRLSRAAWGQGFATEASAGALKDIFRRTTEAEIACFAVPDNARSFAVMRRLGLRRTPERDFLYENGIPAIMHVADRDAWS